ncbi:MAG TPA: response regulator [Syntrophales bacterium]|nr:response regulator [Syntrophales bacterium]
MMHTRILVVDDEKDIVDLVTYNLEQEKFSVIKAYDGESALDLVKTKSPDLIVLDLMLPGIRGIEVCRLIRKNPETEFVPIIMLTARSDQVDKIIGFELGADDYITKPFNVKELIARIRAILKRTGARPDQDKAEILTYEGLSIDFRTYQVTINGEKIDLSPMELKLLRFLVQNPGRVYTRDQILDHVWGDETFVEPRTVDAHISRLRASIESDPNNPQYILTVRGIGYKFAEMK